VPLRVTVAEAAKALGVAAKHVSGIVISHARITIDVANRKKPLRQAA